MSIFKSRKLKFFLAVAQIVIVTIAVYWLEQKNTPSSFLFRYLYLFPIVYSAYFFGTSGGFYAAAISSSLYIPILIINILIYGVEQKNIELIITIGIFLVLGSTFGALIEKTTKSKINYKALYKINRAIASNLMIDKIYYDFLKTILQVLRYTKGLIVVKENNYFDIKVNIGYQEEERHLLKKLNSEPQSTILNLVFSTKKNLIANNPLFDSRFIIPQDQKIAPFALIPIGYRDYKVGVLVLETKSSGQKFEPTEIKLLNTVTSHLALAIQNISLHDLATTDGLTGLFVHRYFDKRLEIELKKLSEPNQNLSLIMADIDKFKMINDAYGHQQGDLVLKEIAKIITKSIPNQYVACRYGGEEFALIAPNQNKFEAARVAEVVRKNVEQNTFFLKNNEVRITLSLGIATAPQDTKFPKELTEKADSALYQAKQTGRNKVCLYQTPSTNFDQNNSGIKIYE